MKIYSEEIIINCFSCNIEIKTKCSDRKYCDECNKEKTKERNKKWRQTNSDKIKEYHQEYFQKNKRTLWGKERERRKSGKHIEARRRDSRKCKYKRRKEAYFKFKVKYNSDSAFKLRVNMTAIINSKMKKYIKNRDKTKFSKPNKYNILINSGWLEFAKHIESQFKEGMSWENYGEWVVDHIVPCAYFNLNDKEHQIICFNYLNTQPLWKRDNLIKSKKLPENYREIINNIEKSLSEGKYG